MTKIPTRTKQSVGYLEDMCKYIASERKAKEMKVLEIGAYAGDSTDLFCKYFGFVETIDPWENNVGEISDNYDMDEVYNMFCDKMKRHINYKVHRDFSYNIVNNFDDASFDMIYIDGLHSAVKEDIVAYLPKIKPNGILAGHDYNTRFKEVRKAVDEMFGMPDKRFRDTSWMVYIGENNASNNT